MVSERWEEVQFKLQMRQRGAKGMRSVQVYGCARVVVGSGTYVWALLESLDGLVEDDRRRVGREQLGRDRDDDHKQECSSECDDGEVARLLTRSGDCKSGRTERGMVSFRLSFHDGSHVPLSKSEHSALPSHSMPLQLTVPSSSFLQELPLARDSRLPFVVSSFHFGLDGR